MTNSQKLKQAVVSADANEDFTEAVLRLFDQTRLCFCHRVSERWAKAVGPEGAESEGGLAKELLAEIRHFRLNAKHLDIVFSDASRWEEPLR